MTDFSIRSEANPQFHLDIRSWPDSVVQLAIHADNTTHAALADRPQYGEGETGSALALQLNPTQIRELIDHLEAFAAPRELEFIGVLDQTSDLCGSGDQSCPDFCCREIKEAGVAYLGDAVAVPAEQESILAEAQRIVHGPRRASYGHPSVNFQRIADLWNGYRKGIPREDFNPTDVAMLLILLKMARIMHGPTDRDGHTDICGYAACSAIINGIDPS